MSDIISSVQSMTPDPTRVEYLLIFSRAREGRLQEFRQWYDDTHIPEILEKFPGLFVSANRADLSGGDFDSLAEYAVEGSAREAWATVRGAGILSRGEDLDYESARVLFASA